MSSGEELGLSPHAEQRTVSPLMGKIRHLLADFDNRLAARKQKLDDTVRIHRLTEEVRGGDKGCGQGSWRGYMARVVGSVGVVL